MLLSTFILLLVWLINFSLLIFILVQKNRPRRWPIFTMVALLFIWQASELANIFLFLDSPYLLLSVRFGLLPTLYLAPTWVWLTWSLFDHWSTTKLFKKILWFVPAIILSPLVFTDYNLSKVIFDKGELSYVPGPIYIYFVLYFALLMAYGLYYLIRNRKTAASIVKRQIDYIFIATALVALSAILLNVVLPLLGVSNLYYIGVNVSIFFTAIVTYALFHERFYDLRIASYRTVVDLWRLFITGAIFYLLFILLKQVIVVDFNQGANIIVGFIVLGLLAPIVFEGVSRSLDYLIVNPAWDYTQALDNIAKILRSSQDLNFLLANLTKEISHIIDYNDIYLYLSKRHKPDIFYQVFPSGERLLALNENLWLQKLAQDKEIKQTAELVYWQGDSQITAELLNSHIDIALPVFYNQQLLGILLIDNKQKLLSIQQLEFLIEVNKYLDIAIGSLLLYEQALVGKQS